MKKIFEIEGRKIILYKKDNRIFSVFDLETKQLSFFDEDGNEVASPDIKNDQLENDRFCDDPTYYNSLGNGYYAFTTHPIIEDPDGPYGCFGIKDKNGRIIIEEKYWQIRDIFNGLFPVQKIDGDWGCANETGELVVPCIYGEPPYFNKYGLAYGNNTLVDMQGNEIAGTEFNCIESYDENDRYLPIILTTEEQSEQISEAGTAEGITIALFDTKLRKYVVKGIPDGSIDVEFYDGKPEPIIEASKMLDLYDKLKLEGEGFIVGKKGNRQDVFDYFK